MKKMVEDPEGGAAPFLAMVNEFVTLASAGIEDGEDEDEGSEPPRMMEAERVDKRREKIAVLKSLIAEGAVTSPLAAHTALAERYGTSLNSRDIGALLAGEDPT